MYSQFSETALLRLVLINLYKTRTATRKAPASGGDYHWVEQYSAGPHDGSELLGNIPQSLLIPLNASVIPSSSWYS